MVLNMTMKASHSPNVARGIVSGKILLDIRDSCDGDPQYMRSQIRHLQNQLGLSTQALAEKWQESGISPETLDRLEAGDAVSQEDLLQAQLLLAHLYAEGLLANRAEDADEAEPVAAAPAEQVEAAAEAEPAEAAAEAAPSEVGADLFEAEDKAS